MAACARWTSRSVMFVLTLIAAGCGGEASLPNSTGTRRTVVTDQVATGPTPTEMCGADASVAVAAYDLASGAFKWAACDASNVRRSVLEASDEAVYVEIFAQNSGTQELAAYDAANGNVLPNGGPAENQPSLPDNTRSAGPVIVDGVRIEGGQDDPTTAIDDPTGRILWTKPGSPVYDDVLAVGDGAVFVTDHQRSFGFGGPIVAYELTSGEIRWTSDPNPADVVPWHVDRAMLFAIWTNVAVISTADGLTIWRSQYPNVDFPRMTGVRANSDTLFIAFSSIASGGD